MTETELPQKHRITNSMVVTRIASVLIAIYSVVLVFAIVILLFYMLSEYKLSGDADLNIAFGVFSDAIALALCALACWVLQNVNIYCYGQSSSTGIIILLDILILVVLYIMLLIVFLGLDLLFDYVNWLRSLHYISFLHEEFLLGMINTFLSLGGLVCMLVDVSIVICSVMAIISCVYAVFQNKKADISFF